MPSTTRSNRSPRAGLSSSSQPVTSPQEPSIAEASPTSRPPMLPGLDSGTSSRALEDGPTRSDSPASPTTPTSGLGPVRVSRSARRGDAAARMTLDIFGPPGLRSSASAALQSSLESRLRALMGLLGSTVYLLTWKDAVTPAGRRLLVRAAYPLRMRDTGCTSWPTPTRQDAARMSGWPTASATDWKGADLAAVVSLAGWATPTVSQAGGTAEQFLERKARTRSCGVALTDLGLQVSTWIHGETPSGSTAPTASGARSQLNPRFSLWLMGYPTAWASCGEAVTRSSRKSPPRSSAQHSRSDR
jgi:hypothetical protein